MNLYLGCYASLFHEPPHLANTWCYNCLTGQMDILLNLTGRGVACTPHGLQGRTFRGHTMLVKKSALIPNYLLEPLPQHHEQYTMQEYQASRPMYINF